MTRRLLPPETMSAGIILSYQCSAECRHCMYACSPKWKEWISEQELDVLLRQIAGKIQPSPYGPNNVSLNHGLHFSGGEPFLDFDLLLKAVELSEELRIPSTFVETNCFWCTSDQVTREKLVALRKAGMKGIMISVNPYYLEFVPFERTERCIRIAQDVFGDNAMVYQANYYQVFKRMGLKGKISIEDYLNLVTNEDLARRVEMFLMGRASYSLSWLYRRYSSEFFLDQSCQPPLLRNWHNHFDNYGNCIPGYCGGVSLGDWHNLYSLYREGMDLSEHPVLSYLMEQDFRGFFRFSHDHGYIENPGGYVSKCHLCVDMRKHLYSLGTFEELGPGEFYSQLE
ncbi:MAG: radical SAM protein [Chloroflexota bacterium]|nr:radical SAM protein [Chloroflexota bacterium]